MAINSHKLGLQGGREVFKKYYLKNRYIYIKHIICLAYFVAKYAHTQNQTFRLSQKCTNKLDCFSKMQ